MTDDCFLKPVMWSVDGCYMDATMVKQLMDNRILDTVCNYKYLGVTFRPGSTCRVDIFKDAYQHVSGQAKKAMFKILKDTRDVGRLPPRVAIQLFDAMVTLILEYGSTLFHGKCDML